MFCRKCGTSLPYDSMFCHKCGTPVKAEAAKDSSEYSIKFERTTRPNRNSPQQRTPAQKTAPKGSANTSSEYSIKYNRTQKSGALSKTALLRDYLEKARTLETDIYTFDAIIEGLHGQKLTIPEKPKAIDAPVNPGFSKPTKPDLKATKMAEYALCSLIVFVASLVLSFLFITVPVVEDIFAIIFFVSFFVTPVLWIKAKLLAKNEDKQLENYNKASSEYYLYETNSQRYQQRQSEIAEYEKQLPKKLAFNRKLDEKISQAKANRKKTQTALTQLYSQNVIYLKYRGLIPVTMFCEYMDSKRRTSLDGENGMYDLYERELLGKQIVGELQTVNSNLKEISYKLDRISNQLVGIQRNQILLYEEVARGNSIAMTISKEISAQKQALNSMSGSLNEMKESAELVAFNTKATKNSTEVLERLARHTYDELHY